MSNPSPFRGERPALSTASSGHGVEFARDIEAEGKDRLESVIEACRLRLRPILMTSFAFILGVLPLVRNFADRKQPRKAEAAAA